MTRTYFERHTPSDLIIVNVRLNHWPTLRMVLDTGASHTTVDVNALQLLGYTFENRIEPVLLETAGGIIATDRYVLKSIESLGILREPFEIQAYDFLNQGILSDYEGILGLDFFEGYHFCIDTLNNQLSIE